MKTIQEQFLAFARSKPPEETYVYSNREVCACAQFAATLGLADQYAEFTVTSLPQPEDEEAPSEMMNLFMPLEVFAMSSPNTWGALVKRMEEALVS